MSLIKGIYGLLCIPFLMAIQVEMMGVKVGILIVSLIRFSGLHTGLHKCSKI